MRFLNFLLVLLLIAAGKTAIAQSAEPQRQSADKLNATLIEVMRDAKRLGYEGRYRKLAPVVKEALQFDVIAKSVLGKYWNSLAPGERDAFVAKLTDLSIATYASQFNAYDGQSFRYDGIESARADRSIVRYTLLVPKGEPVKFDYIVSPDGTRWRIVNIIADGISDLALKRAQYTSIMEREGFASLMAKLSQKIADYAKK
ncbi:MAG: ABC transporter substrate-binding protein [Betaproteobacteria bacterium]|nr:ABC transporter substrate-binding protein [Betaproteobacteria bacterium]